MTQKLVSSHPHHCYITGAPELKDLMNKIAVVIPAKWRPVGIQLGLSPGNLDNIQSQNAGKPDSNLESFEKMFTQWKLLIPSPYTWSTIIDVLQTPAVGEVQLANTLAMKH